VTNLKDADQNFKQRPSLPAVTTPQAATPLLIPPPNRWQLVGAHLENAKDVQEGGNKLPLTSDEMKDLTPKSKRGLMQRQKRPNT
jgi:hypothetical protein